MRFYLYIIAFLISFDAFSQQLNWEWSSNPSSYSDSYRRIHQIEDSIFQISGYIGNPIVMNLTRINSEGDTLSYLNLNSLPNLYFIIDHFSWKQSGYLVAGQTTNSRCWLAGLDSLGNIVWEHFLNANVGFSEISKIQILNDGGYFFVGERVTDANLYFSDVIAGRIDSNGNILWEKHFPIIYNQTAHDFVEMPDGSFFISGYSETVALGSTPYIMQIDIKGNLIAEHYPQINGFANMDINYSRIDLMEDGNAIIAGHSSDPIQSRSAFVAKIDSNAIVEWDTIFFQGSNYKIEPLSNGGVFAQGFTLDSALFLLELDQNGLGLNHFRLPFGYQKQFVDIELTKDGYMIGVGFEQEPNPSFSELYAARYDSVGEAFVPNYCAWNLPEAKFTYDYQAPILTLYDSSYSGLKYHDSIYQFQWYTSLGDSSNNDSLIALFDTTGGQSLDVTLIVKNWHGCVDTLDRSLDFKVNSVKSKLLSNDVKVYPNPIKDFVTIEFINPSNDKSFSSIRLTDLQGHLVMDKKIIQTEHIFSISHFASGVYILEVESKQGLTRKKIIKE